MSQNNGHAQLIAEAKTFLAAEEWQKAADAFAKVLEVNPSEREAVDGLVRALVPLKNFEQAEATLNQAFAGQTDDASYLRSLAWVYEEDRQSIKSLDIYLRLNDAAGVEKSLKRLSDSYNSSFDPASLDRSYEEIRPLLDKVFAQFPAHRAVLLARAELLLELQRYGAVVEAADHLLALDANHTDADALHFKAIAQRTLGVDGVTGQFDEAEKTILAALAAHPDDRRFRYQCVRLYFGKRQYDKAFDYMWQWKDVQVLRRQLSALRRVSPEQLNPAEAERFFEESIKRFPQELSLVAAQGQFYLNQKKYELALASFIKSEDASATERFIKQLYGQIAAQDAEAMAAQAVAHFTKHDGVRHAQAEIFHQRKKYVQAIKACSEALEIEAENFDAQLTKCLSLRMLGRATGDTSKFDEAEEILDEALKKPDDLGYWLSPMQGERSQLYAERGQYQEAFDLIIESENYTSLQTLFYWMGLKGFGAQAERLLHTAERRFADNVEVYIEVLRAGAQLYYAQRLNEKAAVYVDAAFTAANGTEYETTVLLEKLYLVRLQRRFAQAERIVRKELRKNKNHPSFLSELGMIYLDQLQYDKALEQFSEMLGDDYLSNMSALQGSLSALRGLGRNGTPGKFAEAEQILAKVLPIFPEDDALLLEQGWLYQDQNKFKEADDIFAKAAALAEDPRSALLGRTEALQGLKRGDEAIKLLDTLKQQYPNDTDVLERAGWYYMGRNDLDNAKKEFDILLSLDPKSVLGLNGLASIHFAKGEFQEAEEKFSQVNRLEQNNPAVQTNLAWALVRQGGDDKCAKARSLCHDVLKTDPHYPAANSCLGVIAFRLGNSSESEAYLLASTRANSRDGGYSDLGALYVHMARYEEAAEVLKTALEINPYDAQALIQRGYLYLAQEKPKDAVRELRRATVVDKWGEESARMLATALMRAGEYGEAERVLRDALKRLNENRSWQLHLRLSELLIRLGDEKKDKQYYEDALIEASIARRLNNTDAEPYFHEGIALAKLKDYLGAAISLDYCIALKDDHYDARRNQRIVRAKISEQRALNTGSWWGAVIIGGAAVIQLFVVWGMYLKGKISETMLIAMIPLLLGLIVVSLLLRTLVKLKLPGGFEAEVTQTQQTESLSAGPQGSGFSISSSPGGPQR